MTKHQSETERRAQILSAAREEFVAKGYEAARVDDVAARAALSKGAVYFYFPSKRDLFMALILEEHELTYAFLERAEADERSAVEKLLDVGWRYLELLTNASMAARINLMMCELGVRDEDIREELAAIHHRFVDAATRILAQGVAEGAFRPLDPHAVAWLLKAMLDGFSGQAALAIRPDRERVVREGFSVLLRGMLADPGVSDHLLDAGPALG